MDTSQVTRQRRRERLNATFDYFLRPSLRKSYWSQIWRPGATDGGPFNSQQGRAATMRQFIFELRPSLIAETGTHRGTTTEWFSQFYIPVHTVEKQERFHHYARLRLRDKGNVSCMLGDSRDLLEFLAAPRFTKTTGLARADKPILFYLDAHWDMDVPLVDELRLIAHRWPNAAVLIDDFAVPNDSYSYLDMGPGLVLDGSILDTSDDLCESRFQRWYPQIPAYQESGFNTGWVLLTLGQATSAAEVTPGLRPGSAPF